MAHPSSSHCSKDHTPQPAAPVQEGGRDCTVVFPIYNEERELAAELPGFGFFARSHPQMEFCFVDDGSTDRTAQILERFLATENITTARIISLGRNQGKGAAVRAGIFATQTPFVLFADGDFAYPLHCLDTLREQLASAPVVIGSRHLGDADRRRTSLRRTVLGQVFNGLTRGVLGLRYSDTQAGIKGFQLDAAREIFSRLRIPRFAFDVEILVVARALGLSVAEVPVRVVRGHSYKTGKIRLCCDSWRMFFELLQIRRNLQIGLYARPDSHVRCRRV